MMLETPEQRTLARLLRLNLHRYGRQAIGASRLRAAWRTAGIAVRAELLGRLAWHARNAGDAALTTPADPGERLAAVMRSQAQRHDDPQHVVPAPVQLDADPDLQLDAALVLLYACPDRYAALPVDLADPEAAL